MNESLVAVHVFVSGRVQGVAFRWSTQQRALELGVDGWVRNLADGRVEVHVEGPSRPVETLVSWLRHGPPAAEVEEFVRTATEPIGSRSFSVRADG